MRKFSTISSDLKSFRMSSDAVRKIALMNSRGFIVIEPQNVSIADLERLASSGHVVELRSYLKLHKECQGLCTDLDAHRTSFQAVSTKCKMLESTDRPNAKLYSALRKIEGQVHEMGKELDQCMLDLHEVLDDSGSMYELCWSVLNTLQCTIDKMDDSFHLEILEGFERIEL